MSMAKWNPHTVAPSGPETALIAIRPPQDAAEDVAEILLPEIYAFDTKLNMWAGELSGKLLRHSPFWWQSERSVLRGLPK